MLVLVLEDELFADNGFESKLVQAVESLHVGSAWDPKSFVTPLIRPPSGPLGQVVRGEQQDARWALSPVQSPENAPLAVVIGEGATDIDRLRVSRALSLAGNPAITQSTEEFMARGAAMLPSETRRIRLVGRRSHQLYERASTLGYTVIADAVDDDPEVVLRHYVQSQTLSVAYHRYGNGRLKAINPLVAVNGAIVRPR